MTGRGKSAKRVDVNQPEIVRALRDVGASVVDLHELGDGVPDLLVGRLDTSVFPARARNVLMEVKADDKAKLTEDEKTFHSAWRGEKVYVVRSVREALRAIGALVE